MHLSYKHPVTSENQFHCTKLYNQRHVCAVTTMTSQLTRGRLGHGRHAWPGSKLWWYKWRNASWKREKQTTSKQVYTTLAWNGSRRSGKQELTEPKKKKHKGNKSTSTTTTTTTTNKIDGFGMILSRHPTPFWVVKGNQIVRQTSLQGGKEGRFNSFGALSSGSCQGQWVSYVLVTIEIGGKKWRWEGQIRSRETRL